QEQPVAPFVDQLLDTKSTNWIRVAKLVSWLSDDATPAISALVKALDDDNARVRAVAALSLGKLHLKPEICVPALIVAVKDKDSTVRELALSALCSFKTWAKSARAVVIESLDDSVPQIRAAALTALASLVSREEAGVVIPRVVQMLQDPDEMIRLMAADVL